MVRWTMKWYVVLSALFCGVLSNRRGFSAFKFQQEFNKITAERYEAARWNKDFFRYVSVVTFKHNRTCAAMNLTFMANFEMGYETEVVVQAYKFMSNEYRHFPLRFQINLCDALKANAFGVATLKNHGNFQGCPIKKGVPYEILSWTLDGSKFPPLIPEGKYKLDLNGFQRGTDLGVFSAYISIKPPPPKYSK